MWCYIIYSKTIDRFYIGCSVDPVERLKSHNHKKYGLNHFTSKASDWVLFHKIECIGLDQALGIERHIKRMKSRKYLLDLKRYPEIELRLLKKYST